MFFHFKNSAQSFKDGQEVLHIGKSKVREHIHREEYKVNHGQHADRSVKGKLFTLIPLWNKNGQYRNQAKVLKERCSKRADDVKFHNLFHLVFSDVVDPLNVMVLPSITLDGPTSNDKVIHDLESFIIEATFSCLQSFSPLARLVLKDHQNYPNAKC